ncbi:UNVERIFIED_CONTAM: hypothetical protein Scaly_0072400 [Sesamum calycinum]|uniref:HAT C-terminal dimerisation domain-containing protein n=1 Tax=Sesamum calycinum TaxID=2727403 RepID=A0AAW2SVU8_9LAMI
MLKSEAKSLANSLESFEFLLGIVIQYDILFCINLGYRKTGFAASLNIAKDLAFNMDVEPTFPMKCRALRKKQYDENTNDEDVRSPEEAFEYDYFNDITDMAILSLRNSTFSHGDNSDVDLNDLYSELKILQRALPNKFISTIAILEFVKTLDCFPNISITCRIFLIVPMIVASAERSFSKLKLLKTYLRLSMLQERLNGLAIFCIENDMLGKIDVDSTVDDFASRNARPNYFS